jgi:HYR domain
VKAVLLTVTLLLALATSADGRQLGSLTFTANFDATPQSGGDCPPGTPPKTECLRIYGHATVPGLGRVTELYKAFVDLSNPNCRHTTFSGVGLAVAGNGSFDATLSDRDTCDPSNEAVARANFTITGGSGELAGGTGSGTRDLQTKDTWIGKVTVYGYDFDLAPPTIRGAFSRTVRVPKRAKGARVRFAVTARDNVDTSVRVKCTRRSGSFFRVGKTRVTCTSTDSSANTASKSFTVTVRRR